MEKMEYVVVEAAVVVSELRKYWLVGEAHSLTDIINKRACIGHTPSHGGLLVDVKRRNIEGISPRGMWDRLKNGGPYTSVKRQAMEGRI